MSLGFPTKSDKNRAVQISKMVRDLKSRMIQEVDVYLQHHKDQTESVIWVKCLFVKGLRQKKNEIFHQKSTYEFPSFPRHSNLWQKIIFRHGHII